MPLRTNRERASGEAVRSSSPRPAASGGAGNQTIAEAPAEAISIAVSVSCDGWLAACPDAEALVATAARAALEGAARRGGAALVVGIVLTEDAEQRQLNRTFRGKDAATNVLSFAIGDLAAAVPPGSPILLGDIVLAFETVVREAAEQRKKPADHLRHLVVHGMLHLLGFDHEDDAAAAQMAALEVEILTKLGVPAPYDDPM